MLFSNPKKVSDTKQERNGDFYDFYGIVLRELFTSKTTSTETTETTTTTTTKTPTSCLRQSLNLSFALPRRRRRPLPLSKKRVIKSRFSRIFFHYSLRKSRMKKEKKFVSFCRNEEGVEPELLGFHGCRESH